MSASSALSGKSNDPTVMTAPCWAAPPAWSAGPLPQAQHTIASARQTTYAAVRRSGAALMTFPAGREEKVAPQASEPGIPFLRAARRTGGAGGRPARPASALMRPGQHAVLMALPSFVIGNPWGTLVVPHTYPRRCKDRQDSQPGSTGSQ